MTVTNNLAQQFDPMERRNYLGGSEIASVMGLDRYSTPLDIYNRKLGLVDDFVDNGHIRRGNRLEAVAAEYYTELTGFKAHRRNRAYVSTEYPFIVGHVDRVIVGESRLLEIKCPSVAAFRKLQREGLSESYIIQAQVYMHLSKMPRLTWAIFCADLWDLAVFDIEYDERMASTAIKFAADFWNEHILAQKPPIADKPKQAEVEIEKIGGTVTYRDDDTFGRAITALAEAKQILADGKDLEELAKKEVAAAVENIHGVYEGFGYRLHFTETKGKKTFDKKALAAENPTLNLKRYEKVGKPGEQIRLLSLNNSGGE